MKLEEIPQHASYELNYLEHCCLIKSSCKTSQKIRVNGVRITNPINLVETVSQWSVQALERMTKLCSRFRGEPFGG